MKILTVFIHYPVSSGTFLTRALRRLGHEVRSLGPTTGRAIWGVEVPEEYVQTPNYEHAWVLGQPFPIVQNIADFGALDGWMPDLIITSDSNYTVTGRATVPHVLFGADNHVRNYRALQAEGAEWDAMFMAHSWGARIGEPGVFWCPPGYDPEAHTDLGLERDMDVALLGYPYPARMELRQAFTAAGLRGLFAIGPVWDRYNAAYNQAKIAVVKSVTGDLPQRFLENMAQGCCVLADRIEDAGKLGFVAGVDYWPYTTPAEAVREAFYLRDTGQWREIAANGKKKVVFHTWDVRAEQILDTVFAKERA
jgi:hypothetical protein